MHAIGRVYPFVCLFVFTPYYMNQLTCDFDFACTWTLTVDRISPRIESRGHRSDTKERGTGVFSAASYEYSLTVVVVGIHSDVIGCELVRRGVRRGAVDVRESMRAWAWWRGRFDVGPRSRAVYFWLALAAASTTRRRRLLQRR